MSLIYLATPYTHDRQDIRASRYEAVTFVAAKLVLDEKIIFSPITMTHPYDQIMAGDGGTLGSDYWLDFDQAFLEACDEIAVLKLPGWQDSSGVNREIKHFADLGKKPTWLEPSDFGVVKTIDKYAAAWDIKTE